MEPPARRGCDTGGTFLARLAEIIAAWEDLQKREGSITHLPCICPEMLLQNGVHETVALAHRCNAMRCAWGMEFMSKMAWQKFAGCCTIKGLIWMGGLGTLLVSVAATGPVGAATPA